MSITKIVINGAWMVIALAVAAASAKEVARELSK